MSVEKNKNIIEVEDLSFSYGSTLVLKNVSFAIREGEYLGVIGPNGSGKTTLLKVILGLFKPTTGTVKLFGQSLESFRDWSKIGYVPQKAINFDPLFPATVYEVASMGRFGKKNFFRGLNQNDHKIIRQALNQVEMLDHKDRLIGDLSGGQQQRVFIARALAGEPRVIFLDEPTVGVDVKTQEQFYELLRWFNQDLGLTLVLVSHDVDVIANEVTELICMNQTLVFHGTTKEFIHGDYLDNLYGKNTRFISHRH